MGLKQAGQLQNCVEEVLAAYGKKTCLPLQTLHVYQGSHGPAFVPSHAEVILLWWCIFSLLESVLILYFKESSLV